MIDYDRTLSVLGVDANKLSHGSVKKVFAICDECGTYRKLPYQAYRDLCVSCSHADYQRFYEPKIVKVCEWCQEEYEIIRSHAKQSRFCSRKCKDEWRSKNVRGEDNWSWKPKIIKICNQCGNEYEVTPAITETSRFCSNKCHNKWKSINLRGEKNSGWKGGMSFGKYCRLFNQKFKETIRDRHNRRCFLCGKSEEDNNNKLCVHHVNYDKNCLCGSVCEFVPLCNRCHSKTNHNRRYWEDLIMCHLYQERAWLPDI